MTQEVSAMDSLSTTATGLVPGFLESFSTPSSNTAPTLTPQDQEQEVNPFLSLISPCWSSVPRAWRRGLRTPTVFSLPRVATTESVEEVKPSEDELSRERSLKAIEDQKRLCGRRRDTEVLELFLTRKKLTDVVDLARFQRLRHLWLSFNQLCNIAFLLRNHCLSELYLDHNNLYQIEGLRHLVSLKILMLHNNQLKNLESVVDELKLLTGLKTINLYRNPMSQDAKYYRLYTIFRLPSVWLLDRKEITLKERKQAYQIYNNERFRVYQTIAFRERVDTFLRPHIPQKCRSTVPRENVCSNQLNKNLFHNKEDSVFVRAMKRSSTQFTMLNWNSIPTRVERHSDSEAKRTMDRMTIWIR
ncbi:leucine-rich repeat-containing protein 72 [Monodelphis domestica]|uniref:Leucine rich repeat containing 72 n=1 Tax=Monodelphis domestica TaxID=13616 RepID=K7E3V4_MONDO|nr:leucine-rich repeat-containing protein 72 [Monodelphis domestica]